MIIDLRDEKQMLPNDPDDDTQTLSHPSFGSCFPAETAIDAETQEANPENQEADPETQEAMIIDDDHPHFAFQQDD